MVVYVDMCADLMHIGHVRMLKAAKEIATELHTTLLAGVHSSDAVASYKRRPILTLHERVGMVQACRYVDNVVENAPLIIDKEFMSIHDITLVIHAHDKDDTSYDKMYAVPIEMKCFMRLDYTDSISTTDIIKRIRTTQICIFSGFM